MLNTVPKVLLKVPQAVVDTLVLVVQTHPRDEVKDKPGTYHKSIFDYEAATGFYTAINEPEKLHPLADVKNDDCSWEHPCGKCRFDLLINASYLAQEAGRIVRIPPKVVEEEKTDSKGRTRKIRVVKGHARYYLAGEVPQSTDYKALAKKIASMR